MLVISPRLKVPAKGTTLATFSTKRENHVSNSNTEDAKGTTTTSSRDENVNNGAVKRAEFEVNSSV